MKLIFRKALRLEQLSNVVFEGDVARAPIMPLSSPSASSALH
jgi:hypothetical protein